MAYFRRPVLEDGALSQDGEDTGRSWPSYEFVSELRYLDAFSNAGASKLSDVENDAKFRTF